MILMGRQVKTSQTIFHFIHENKLKFVCHVLMQHQVTIDQTIFYFTKTKTNSRDTDGALSHNHQHTFFW